MQGAALSGMLPGKPGGRELTLTPRALSCTAFPWDMWCVLTSPSQSIVEPGQV